VRFPADMGISWRVCRWLSASGHDVVHLRDQGLHRLPNGEIFQKAAAEGRIVLTFDLDFGEIVATADEPGSVIVFRLHNTTTAHVIGRLQSVLATSIAALEQGAIIVVEEGRYRVRRLPFSE
jgi:predicted nuclease of predicted toxin-antitoxin system